MGRQFSAKTFLRNTPNDLLKQYFEQRGVDLGFNWSYRHESDVNPVFAAMEQLAEATRSRVDGDFSMVNDLACEAGELAILDKAGGRARGLANRFAKMKNAYERAFWTFLHEPDLFRLAGCFHETDRRPGWRRRFVGVRLNAATENESLRAFEQALRMQVTAKKALRAALQRLRALGLVAKPPGKQRKGVAITPAGRDLLTHHRA